MSFHVDGLRGATPPPRVAAACTQPVGTRPLDCGRSAPCGDRGRGSGNCANCPIPLRSRNRPYSGAKKLKSRLRSALAQYRVTSLPYPGRCGDRRSAKPVAQIAEIGVSPKVCTPARIANWVAETALTAPTACRDAMWWWASWQSDLRKYRELTKACNSGPSVSLETASSPGANRRKPPCLARMAGRDKNPALYTVRKNYLARRAGSAVRRKLKAPSGRRSGEEFRCR
jgi:hypothetical protein